MKRPTDIAYVDLESVQADDHGAAFLLQHLIDSTYQPSEPDAPHRHNFQEIFVVQSGAGQHAIDGELIDLVPGTVSLIGQGHVHRLDHVTSFTGWIIRFSDDFLPADVLSQTWNYHTTLFNQLGRSHSLQGAPSDLRELVVVLDLMEAEWHEPATFQSENALRHLLALLIIRLERIYQNSFGTAQNEREAYRVYQQFMSTLDRHFADHHDVQFYATALGIAPVRLSRMLSRIVGKATKQIIDERIVLEAKRFLQYTDRSIKEIAEALGYNDMFQFSKTFKRLTGSSPNTFRERVKK